MEPARTRRRLAALLAATLLVGAAAVETTAPAGAQAAVTPTTVTVTSSPASPIAGDSVTFTATVSPSSATGSVQFAVDSTALGTATLSGGSATSAATTTLDASAHTVTASYLGDATHAASEGSTTVTVGRIATSLSLATNPFGLTFANDDGNTSLVATITPSDATGTVQFSLDGSPVGGPATISNGTASANPAMGQLSAGQHTMSATYSGDGAHAPSSLGPQTFWVSMEPNTFQSFTSPASIGRYDTATFSASLAFPPESGGAIQFTIDGVPIGDPTPIAEDGSATATFPVDATLGSHTAGAQYAGDETFAGVQATSPLEVVKSVATITPPAGWYQQVHAMGVVFTMTVGPGKPNGQIQVEEVTAESAPSYQNYDVVDGQVSFIYSDAPAQGIWLRVTYLGDDSRLPSVPISAGFYNTPENSFLGQAYDTVLDRRPDTSGFLYWQGRLASGTTSPTGVVDALAASTEGRTRIVRDSYLDILRRQPDPSGLAYWRGRLARGTTHETLRADLLSSDEAYRRAGSTPSGFIGLVYEHDLDRTASASDVAYWTRRIGSAPSRATRQKAAVTIGRSSEATRAAVRAALLDGCRTTEATDAQRTALAAAWPATGRHTTRLAGAALAQVCFPTAPPATQTAG
jgi:hypothetical protein